MPGVEMRELRLFLVLADEPYLGRAAERPGLEPPTTPDDIGIQLIGMPVRAR
jgi:hypothetical protein